tara:strand:- start:288 stop:770 length:483 start_codon:yes stop_codon:yes gene_type:complete
VRVDTIIIDDFLDNPDIVRNSVLGIDFSTSGQFPGLRSDRADDEYQEMVTMKIAPMLSAKTLDYTMDSFRFQLCLEGAKTWVHKDDSQWAGVLYLTPGADPMSGTGIFDEEDTLITLIGNVYNRLVLYRGDLFHRSLMPGFGTDVSTGRLTQVFFFNIIE